MPHAHGYLHALLKNIGALRQKAGLTQAQLEERLILGPGWISRFESGETVPSIDMVLAILHETNATFIRPVARFAGTRGGGSRTLHLCRRGRK